MASLNQHLFNMAVRNTRNVLIFFIIEHSILKHATLFSHEASSASRPIRYKLRRKNIKTNLEIVSVDFGVIFRFVLALVARLHRKAQHLALAFQVDARTHPAVVRTFKTIRTFYMKKKLMYI